MGNAAQLGIIRAQAQYLGEGLGPILDAIRQAVPEAAKNADSLKVYAATVAHTITALDASTGAYPIALIAKSNGEACSVHLYADDAATVGTTDSLLHVKVSGTAGEISAAILLGAGPRRLGATSGSGIGIAAPATTVGIGAVTNDPDVWVVYVDA